jgi:RNA polymerase sigma factor (sigma-70 family)
MSPSTTFDRELVAMLPRLRRFAFSLSRNGTDADDLTQATVERALRSRAQWQDGTRLDSWLYRIMRNLWVDIGRSRSRRAKVEAPEDEAQRLGEDPREAIEASIELQRMTAAMQRLPEEQREVVSLILIAGFGYRETAEVLKVPIGTVSSRLVRGRTALLEMVGARNDN